MVDPFVEKSYSYMVEKVSDYAIFLVDCSGIIRTWNPAAEVMNGYAKNEIVGCHISFLYSDEDRRTDNPKNNLQKAAEQGTFQEEAWRQRKDGTRFWALVEIIAVKNEVGKLIGFCKLIRDISERRFIEASLREADRHKNEFLALLAHELRNPLAALSASAVLLSKDVTDPGFAKKASYIIGRQVKQMTGLVDDLLDVSRVSRGRISLDMAEVDIKTVIGNAIEQVRPFIESRNQTLKIHLTTEAAYVNGDEKRLIQVISNMLGNATKYTSLGGEIKLKLLVEENEVYIEISDNGVGIDPSVQGVIFELFEQVQGTSSRTTGGLGIGLALVRSLLALHEGTVACYSEGIGHGSRFTICIPRLAPNKNLIEQHSA